MKIKHLHIENFCGLKIFDKDFYDRTLICGANATGKSTVRNCILWTLTGKLADGSAADGIRPHDADGVDTNYVDIVSELTVEHDGRDITFKRTQHQKWVAHRGTNDKSYEGDETLYEINGIPKKLKDYQAYIDGIVDTETLLYGTNAQAFLGLETKKRRAKLMSLVGDSSLEDIAKNDPKYSDIVPMLMDGTVEELLTRSRKVIKEKNEQLKAIPIRIDELSKQIVDADFSELELAKKTLEEDIEKLTEKIGSKNNRKAIEDLEQEKFELQFNINDCKRKAHDDLMQNRHKLNSELVEQEIIAEDAQREISQRKERIELNEKVIEENTATINALTPQYEAAKAAAFDGSKWVFDESSTFCSLCGQRLPDRKIEELKKDFTAKKEAAKQAFEKQKADTVEDIKTRGNKLAVVLKELRTMVSTDKMKINDLEYTFKTAKANAADIKSKLASLPTEPNMIGNKWYAELVEKDKQLTEQIAELRANIADTSKLEADKENLEAELVYIENQLAQAGNNVRIDERITELNAEQRNIAQAVADEERIRDLLEALNREYVEVLTDKVNSFFTTIKWKMFKENKTNDGYLEICEPCVEGTSYYRTLNHGAKLLADIEIMKAFQDLGGVKLFLTLDDAESVDDWRIPEVDRQLIIFRRVDDEHLLVMDKDILKKINE